jgi:hypothetical protein
MPLMRVSPEDVSSYVAFPSQDATVETLCYATRELALPGCIALYGAWGSGKSTVLRKAAQQLGADGTQMVPVYFDPWEHERRQDVITPLLLAMYGANPQAKSKERAIKGVAAVLRGLSKVAWRLGSAAALRKLGVDPDEARLLTTDATADVRDALRQLQHLTDEVNEVKKQFATLVHSVCGDDPNRRLVVLLDDLDRCLPDTAVGLIEAIKLALCGSHEARVCFVFALDRVVLGEAIRHRYPSASAYSAESYLEKIFDLSLEMPPVTGEDITELLRGPAAGLTGLQDQLNDAFKAPSTPTGAALVSQVLAHPVFANPRVAQRVFNRLALLLRDDSRRQQLGRVALDASYRRFVAWVAGAERYRAIRDFLHRASSDEWSDLASACGSAAGQPKTTEVKQFLASPHTMAYLALLNPKTDDRTLSGGLKTLGDFDALLRRAGL